MRATEKNRLISLLLGGLGLLLAGGVYAAAASRIGGIPCLFHQITGLKCPGCGVTRMCLSLLRGDFAEAFHQNAAIFCLLPLGAVLAVSRCVRYVKAGSKRLSRWENRLVLFMVAVLVLFGIVRNFTGL